MKKPAYLAGFLFRNNYVLLDQIKKTIPIRHQIINDLMLLYNVIGIQRHNDRYHQFQLDHHQQ